MVGRKLSNEEARNLIWDADIFTDENGKEIPIKEVNTETIDERRWSMTKQIVFQRLDDLTYFAFEFEDPKNENADFIDVNFGDIEVYAVEPHTRTIIEYVKC